MTGNKQRAAEAAAWASRLPSLEYRVLVGAIAEALDAKDAEWKSRIKALAATWSDGPFADAVVFTPAGCAADLRSLIAEAGCR